MPRTKSGSATDGRRKPRSPEVKEALRRALTGRVFSPETLARMSAAAKARAKWCVQKGRVWTVEEDELVRTLPPREVAQRTQRTLGSVTRRRVTLGLPPLVPQWTEAEDRLIRTRPPADVVVLTGRTLAAVYARRQALGASRMRRSASKPVKHRIAVQF